MDDLVNEAEYGLETVTGEVREFLYGVDLVYISLLSSVFFVTLIVFDIAYNFTFPGRFDLQRKRRQWRQSGDGGLGHGGGFHEVLQGSGGVYPYSESYWRDRSNDLTNAVHNAIDTTNKKLAD